MGVCIALIIVAILAAVVLQYIKKNKVAHFDKEEEEPEFDNDRALGKLEPEEP